VFVFWRTDAATRMQGPLRYVLGKPSFSMSVVCLVASRQLPQHSPSKIGTSDSQVQSVQQNTISSKCYCYDMAIIADTKSLFLA
jgi:hypothetical protein